MLPDRELSARQQAAGPDAAVSVGFRGPFEGRLVVRAFGGVLPTLAMNMLGEEEAPPAALQRDALGEVANVICGNLLPAIAGSREVFRLDAPVPEGPEAAAPGAPLLSSAVLGLEDGRAEILLYATPPLASPEVAP